MTDAEWAVVRPLLPVPGWLRGRGGQPEAYCHRQILDAIRYLVDNGIKWRAMPARLPAVGPGLRVLPPLARARPGQGVPRPAAIEDPREGRADCGADSRGDRLAVRHGGRGRRLGQPQLRRREAGQRAQAARRGRHARSAAGRDVTAADTGDRTAAQALLRQAVDAQNQLELVGADGGYTGNLVEHCLTTLALVLAIVKRSDDMRGFVVLPKRWIVERLFAQLMPTRRLARDYKRRTTSAEAMIYWSMTQLMTRRLAQPHPQPA
ncbi:transposase [Streptomyces sp. NPDC057456]|uniref:transposase n=1 Tax=Streptomyces sp. NPDC057456 TaxID=3346139 RepID=UPI0036B00ED4